jgi:hypothetical protein
VVAQTYQSAYDGGKDLGRFVPKRVNGTIGQFGQSYEWIRSG